MYKKTKSILFLIVLPLIFYSPIFLFEFGIHNDYSAFDYPKPENLLTIKPENLFPETNHLLLVGRPIGAILLNLQFLFINNIEDLAIARLISLFFLAFNAYLLMSFFLQNKFLNYWEVLTLAFCFMMLPTNQLFVIWATNFVPGIIANFFAIISYFILDKTKIKNLKHITKREILLYFSAFLNFLISLLIYPPTATFVFIFTFSKILFTQFIFWKKTRIYIVRDIIFYGFSILFYFCLTKLVILPYLVEILKLNMIDSGVYQMNISSNILNKVFLFFKSYSIAWSGSMYILFQDNATKIIIGILMVVGMRYIPRIIKMAKYHNTKYRTKWILEFSIALFILLLLLNLSLLAAKGFTGHEAFWRGILPYCTACMIFLCRITISVLHLTQKNALQKQQLLSIGSIVIIVILCGTITFSNLYKTSLNCNKQLNFIRNQITSQIALLDLSEHSEVQQYLLGIHLHSSAVSSLVKNLTLEFGQLSIIPTDGILKLSLEESGINLSNNNGLKNYGILNYPEMKNSKYFYTMNSQSNIIIIDFNDMLNVIPYTKLPSIKVSASMKNTLGFLSVAGLNAVDGHPDTFWEVNELPQWLQFELPKSQKITKYSFSLRPIKEGVIHPPERMPKQWQVLGSNDNQSWVELDRRQEKQKNWIVGQEREYQIKNISQNYKYYRFLFQSAHSNILRINEMKIAIDDES